MLSGEGNAGERWKTTIGLISKKETLHAQHTFFVHFFAVVLHDYNVKLPQTLFMEEMPYVFTFTFFFTAAHFHLALVAASISHFGHRCHKIFMLFFQQKNVSFDFSLSLPFSRWVSLACRLITSSCIWVAIPVDWVILHWYACGADGRSLGRAYGHLITKFSRIGRLPHFLTHGTPLRARELR